MISIRKQIDQSEKLLLQFRALRKAYVELTRALPKAALPVNPELSGLCKDECDKFTALLDDAPAAQMIDQAGKIALVQLEAIYHSNRAGIEERSEEQRVGQECRSRWSPYDYKKSCTRVEQL